MLDLDVDSKLRLLFGGTSIVQHSPPPKNDAGLKCKRLVPIGHICLDLVLIG